ncbi:MAG: hypothetical protein J6B34_05575 [Clostridia bacterium]|nr:hypothetical protein [Clostridia bacterium]
MQARTGEKPTLLQASRRGNLITDEQARQPCCKRAGEAILLQTSRRGNLVTGNKIQQLTAMPL